MDHETGGKKLILSWKRQKLKKGHFILEPAGIHPRLEIFIPAKIHLKQETGEKVIPIGNQPAKN